MYFLGIDAGGTKTSFALSDESGRIHARHTSGPCAFFSTGSEKLTAIVADGVAAICTKAGIAMDALTYAALGIPGYGEGEDVDVQIRSACEKAGLSGKIVCECDCYIGWAGSLAMKPGINIISGTGSICYGVDADGKSARSSGWGAYCDEGSCRWLGERLITFYTKQADGRMPRTVLYEMFRAHFNIKEDLHFIKTLNHELDNVKTAKLQILLGEIYDRGDALALALYDCAADELTWAASSVAEKLDMPPGWAVSYSGGLFRSGERILAPLTKRLEMRGGQICAPKFTPELGAVLMAMRQVDTKADFGEFEFTE
ncbi:MAG: hypothetical protein FWH02_09060 [Oscillospiraceae bacterium]|nr:hypothetical protein [Oscillospiraceae bacterium]